MWSAPPQDDSRAKTGACQHQQHLNSTSKMGADKHLQSCFQQTTFCYFQQKTTSAKKLFSTENNTCKVVFS
jgi:hypothetical protein